MKVGTRTTPRPPAPPATKAALLALAALAAPAPAKRKAAHGGVSVTFDAFSPHEQRRYKAYVRRVRRKLERLRPEQFRPDLRLYDELLSSLEIRK